MIRAVETVAAVTLTVVLIGMLTPIVARAVWSMR